MNNEQFTKHLENLAGDYKESGYDATAQDLLDAAQRIKDLEKEKSRAVNLLGNANVMHIIAAEKAVKIRDLIAGGAFPKPGRDSTKEHESAIKAAILDLCETLIVKESE